MFSHIITNIAMTKRYPTFTCMNDNADEPTVAFNLHMNQPTSSQGINHFMSVYDPSNSSVYIGAALYLTSTSYPNPVVLKLNSLTGAV